MELATLLLQVIDQGAKFKKANKQKKMMADEKAAKGKVQNARKGT